MVCIYISSLYSSWYVAFVFLYKMPSFRFSQAITKKEDFSFRIHAVEEKGIEVNLKVEFVLWKTGEHGKILDVFAITFVNRALTMETTKKR